MQIPLNVLLYRLSAESIYEVQNTDLSIAYDGIKLFVADDIPKDNQRYLYLISEKMLQMYSWQLLCRQFLAKNVFLCIASDKTSHVSDFNNELSMVLLYTNNTLSQVLNKTINIFHDFEGWDKNFHLTLLGGGSLQDLLNITSDILIHPLIIFDRNYSILGYLRVPGITDSFMEELIRVGYVTPNAMAKLCEDGLISTSENAANPLINWYCLMDNSCYYSMMYRFLVNQNTVGYALVFHCTVHPKTNFLYLMNMVCENLNLYFRQERFSSRASSEIYEPILTDILDHPDMPNKQLIAQIGHAPDLELNGRFLLMWITYMGTHELPYSFISWNLRNAIPTLKPFAYKNNLYILKSNTNEENGTSFFSPTEEKIFLENFKDHMFTAGISQLFFSLADLPLAVNQCREAVRIGSELYPEKRNFYCFEDIVIFYTMQELKKTMPIKMIASPYYTILKQYDMEHNSNLSNIFAQFLINGCNINQTSVAIFMHRNTVLNKVKKAVSIMQYDLEDYQSQIFYIVAFLEDQSPLLNR